MTPKRILDCDGGTTGCTTGEAYTPFEKIGRLNAIVFSAAFTFSPGELTLEAEAAP
jgi:hypothetical protein